MDNEVQVFWWLVLMAGWFFVLAIGGAIAEGWYNWQQRRKRKRRGATYV